MDYKFYGVNHVSFDVWLTLIKSNPQFKEERARLIRAFFKLEAPHQQIIEHFRNWDLRFTSINERTGKNLDAEEMICIMLADLNCDLQTLNPELLQSYFEEQEKLFFNFHPALIEDELESFLKNLTAQGISLSILSNTGFIKGRLLRMLLDKLQVGHLFSFQLYSDEIEVSKPSLKAFEKVIEQAQLLKKLSPENILHIGDNSHADGFGANRAGMQHAIINSNQVSLRQLRVSKDLKNQ